MIITHMTAAWAVDRELNISCPLNFLLVSFGSLWNPSGRHWAAAHFGMPLGSFGAPWAAMGSFPNFCMKSRYQLRANGPEVTRVRIEVSLAELGTCLQMEVACEQICLK